MLASTVAMAQNPDATALPNGAELSVEIFNPTLDEELKVPAALGSGGTINVLTDGEASVGQGEPNIHVTFVVDVSGSTDFFECLTGVILDCERAAVVNAINDPNFASVLDVGITVFATDAAFADMSPGGDDDPLTSNFADAITVANSTFSENVPNGGGVAQFTNKIVGNLTDYTVGLQAANNSVAASTAGTKRVFFLSDGNASGANLIAFDNAVAALGVRIDSFAIGDPGSVTCGNPGAISLQRMADLSGGNCVELENPADIITALPNLIATSLDAVSASLDGGAVATNTAPGVPVPGPITALYDAAYVGLGVGDYVADAEATGSDSAGSRTVTALVPFHLLQLAADPSNEINELSVDDEHTVFARILGGTGPDRDIDFSVSAGPNAGPAGSSSAAPSGPDVSFGYSVDGNECSSLGTDTITVSTTIGGMFDSIDLTKDWVDTIGPVASCEATENPNGNNQPAAPGNGGQGQNQDGFYILEAQDNLTGDSCAPLEIFVTDGGSGTVFGPFLVGTEIKYTQDPDATPISKKIGGSGANSLATDTDWHIIGNGDAVVTAVDGTGNVSLPVSCLVPPPPM